MKVPALSASHLVGLIDGLARGFPDRVFGTARGRESAEWIADRMRSIGLRTSFQEFTWEVAGEQLSGANVVGIIDGVDPELKNEFVVVAAHYDSQQDTHQGANDNASGCAGVLAIAEALQANKNKRSILFITFDGEEGIRRGSYHAGRRGSRWYASHPIVPFAKTALLINLDELAQVHLESGSRNDVHLWASDDRFAKGLLQSACESALEGREKAIDGYLELPREAQFFTTDAEPFYRRGVPVLNFLSGRDLANHGPGDDMSRLIPERVEQYVRVAHRAAFLGANHSESLASMGIVPGGLLPTFPLIREKRDRALEVIEEERQRLDELQARLPAFKRIALALARQCVPAGSEISEPTLAAIRNRRDELIDQLHQSTKHQTEDRSDRGKEIDRLGSIADVLSGALYLANLGHSGAYYQQRIPEKLEELVRGAKRLGLDSELAGIVREDDVLSFTATVDFDRALHVARDSLANLNRSISRAVYASWSPESAAETERTLELSDQHELSAMLRTEARKLSGDVGRSESDVKRTVMLQAMLETQLLGVRGSGEIWLSRFAQKNQLTDFVAQVRALDLPIDEAEQLETALMQDDIEELQRTVGAFYGRLTEVVFGERIDTVDALERLDRHRIGELVASATSSIESQNDRALLDRASVDPALQKIVALSDLVQASLAFASLYRKDGAALDDGVKLTTVEKHLDRIAERASAIEGGQKLADEIRFWSEWVKPFVQIEGRAELQAKLRREIAESGLTAIQRLRHAQGDAASSAARALQDAERALGTLTNAPSPLAERRFGDAVDRAVALFGDEARGLVAIRDRFAQKNEDVRLGRREGHRTGPLGMIELFAQERA